MKNDLEVFLRWLAGRAFRAAFLRRDFGVRRAGVGLESTVSQDATVSCILGDIPANDLTALNFPPSRASLRAFFRPPATFVHPRVERV